jgi:LemA protein
VPDSRSRKEFTPAEQVRKWVREFLADLKIAPPALLDKSRNEGNLRMPSWVWIFIAALVVFLLYGLWTYNRLVGLSKRAEGAWSDIDVQLKRRWDLVPALVATVQGYARYESETLEKVVAARNLATQAESVSNRGDSERGLSSAVGRIFALAEAYPDLKANQQFLDLQKNLTHIEDQVQSARRYYNAVVRDLNTLIETFPALFVAGAAGFSPREYFQLEDEGQRAAPQVKL